MIEIFTTSVTDESQAASIIAQLQLHIPDCSINFDLEDCDRILRIKGENFSISSIIELIQLQGFFCSHLK
ncbi:MAG: hypothetical protein WCI49_06955 [Ferruginibacter sp.]